MSVKLPTFELNHTLIDTTVELRALCQAMRQHDYVAVDTEFIRDKTFWPKLCLIQLGTGEDIRAVDALAEGLDLSPLFELMLDPGVIKVFHAARQDVEIFYQLSGKIPHPIFDTQIAAMVCGFGDSVGYDKLAHRLAGARIDKTSQYTDWTRRPLTGNQIGYALADVNYLQPIYEKLRDQLEKSGRSSWLIEEMATLTNPATYELHPEMAWQRLKIRSRNREYLGVIKAVAAWREDRAQTRDQPRNHVLRDEAIQELAAEKPDSIDALQRLRAVPKGLARNAAGESLLEAVKRGRKLSKQELPKLRPPEVLPKGLGPMVDLLKVLLKYKCEQFDVSQRLIANVANLERLAANGNGSGNGNGGDNPVLQGWRREIFGEDALALIAGRIALALDHKSIRLVETGNDES